ncbi:MAG: MFS transporter [Proteobacteria bacterium]|nr:MFS transporter [Pseudomonadota bacterium]
MKAQRDRLALSWTRIGTRFLPFADAATTELPLSRLLRLSLFQVTVGMAVVLLIGTLNRVMIVELGVPAWLVAVMVALPLIFAPFRAVVGFRSDHHRSVLGWRRVPYIWMGTLLQFGGLAIMPFALIVLSGDTHGPIIIGQVGAALAFLLVGAGLHTTQTIGLALATDLAPPHAQPRVVALLCTMLLVGMAVSAVIFGLLLRPFSEIRLIQVIQAAALTTMVLNAIALWKQEPRNAVQTSEEERPGFGAAWRAFVASSGSVRQLVAVGLGSVAFSMQDIILEPYGGQILHLPVSATTTLTAMLACGGFVGFVAGAKALGRRIDPYRLAAAGALTGIGAFVAVIFAAPFHSALLFAAGVALIGFSSALFAVGTLTASMNAGRGGQNGLVLGAWGAAQAFAAGAAIALGGLLHDGVSELAARGFLGEALAVPATGYGFVYLTEVLLLFATLVAIGPLIRMREAAGLTLSPSLILPR